MALIEWNETLQLGLQEIDEQHETLVAITNELDDAVRQGKGKYVLGKILEGLSTYAATHFETEEKYFRRFPYAEADTHTREHNDFVSRVWDFWLEFAADQRDLSVDVVNYLGAWLQQHIQMSDRKFVEHFRASGLREVRNSP